MRRIVLGGGTFSHVRTHFSLSAPAFGKTARLIASLLPQSELVLTKMADSTSSLISNNDVATYVDQLVQDVSVKMIFLNVAFCDFNGTIDAVTSGKYAERLETSKGKQTLLLEPAPKVINKVREHRKDIYLIGFKATANASEDEQFRKGLKLLKTSSASLVLANDVVTRRSMIITPEEAFYSSSVDRDSVLAELVEMALQRSTNTFSKTYWKKGQAFDLKSTSKTFQTVMRFLVANGGYISNENGFTAGHYGEKIGDYEFVSSQRKVDHNDVDQIGLAKVSIKDGKYSSVGPNRPTVGSHTILELFNKFPDYDCVIHTHNPLKSDSIIKRVSQREFHCGSRECANNVASNMEYYEGILAVYAKKHGANIMFKSSTSPEKIINFIKKNIQLGEKTR